MLFTTRRRTRSAAPRPFPLPTAIEFSASPSRRIRVDQLVPRFRNRCTSTSIRPSLLQGLHLPFPGQFSLERLARFLGGNRPHCHKPAQYPAASSYHDLSRYIICDPTWSKSHFHTDSWKYGARFPTNAPNWSVAEVGTCSIPNSNQAKITWSWAKMANQSRSPNDRLRPG